MEIDASHAIFEAEVPEEWLGKTIGELDVRRKYNINIIAVKDKGGVNIALSTDTLLKQDATILVIGEHKAIKTWFNI